MDTVPPLRELIPIPSVWDRLDATERRLIEASTADDPFLTEVAQHLLRAGGKRFRPLLTHLAAEFGTPADRRPVEAAVSVELIHVGSLYHDDVIDESATRRGATSANANWSNTIAILAGDFLMARASEVAATYLSQDAVRLLAQTYAELVAGQTLELQLDHDLDHGPDAYFRVIEGKTASLIRTAARLGAEAADADPATVDAIGRWAWELGVVFQISDDALDLVASDEFLGKPAGSDIGEGKMTLPVLLALASPDGDRIRELLATPPYPPSAVRAVIDILVDGGFVDEALAEARRRLTVARRAVAELPPDGPVDVLAALERYLLSRVELARVAA